MATAEMSVLALFHGGRGGLSVGDLILPPNELADLGIAPVHCGVGCTDVYLTPVRSGAEQYAKKAVRHCGAGAVYRVEVDDADLHSPRPTRLPKYPGGFITAGRARVVEVLEEFVP